MNLCSASSLLMVPSHSTVATTFSSKMCHLNHLYVGLEEECDRRHLKAVERMIHRPDITELSGDFCQDNCCCNCGVFTQLILSHGIGCFCVCIKQVMKRIIINAISELFSADNILLICERETQLFLI